MATLIAVLGLLVTMVFNTLGVWQQVRQSELARNEAARAADEAERTRKDTQVGLLTQLTGLAADAESNVVAAGTQITVCNVNETTRKQEAAVYRAAEYYNYLAYLFNQNEIDLASAKKYATPAMLDLYDLAVDTFGLGWVQGAYPDLRRFKLAETAKGGQRDDPCK